mmetsp:Transcript_125435/g.297877  ORF Transcript_125435/g.297877 Transcript_125435/m.297877 type:complete len:242 (-) Transcript_125435:682-1407(-)
MSRQTRPEALGPTDGWWLGQRRLQLLLQENQQTSTRLQRRWRLVKKLFDKASVDSIGLLLLGRLHLFFAEVFLGLRGTFVLHTEPSQPGNGSARHGAALGLCRRHAVRALALRRWPDHPEDGISLRPPLHRVKLTRRSRRSARGLPKLLLHCNVRSRLLRERIVIVLVARLGLDLRGNFFGPTPPWRKSKGLSSKHGDLSRPCRRSCLRKAFRNTASGARHLRLCCGQAFWVGLGKLAGGF